MRSVAFAPQAFSQFTEWADDKKQFQRITALIENITRTPFHGIGKPEPLKGNLKGYWSRRIDQQHRIVYMVTADEILIISCKGHYS
jgi:toxin YoeB